MPVRQRDNLRPKIKFNVTEEERLDVREISQAALEILDKRREMMKRAENGQGSVSWTDLTEATNWEGDNESHSSGSSKTDDEEWGIEGHKGCGW